MSRKHPECHHGRRLRARIAALEQHIVALDTALRRTDYSLQAARQTIDSMIETVVRVLGEDSAVREPANTRRVDYDYRAGDRLRIGRLRRLSVHHYLAGFDPIDAPFIDTVDLSVYELALEKMDSQALYVVRLVGPKEGSIVWAVSARVMEMESVLPSERIIIEQGVRQLISRLTKSRRRGHS